VKSAKGSLIVTNGQDFGLVFHLNNNAFNNILLLNSTLIKLYPKVFGFAVDNTVKNSFSYEISVYLRII